MKAIIKERPAPGIDIGEMPEPSLEDSEVVVAVETVGICGSDVHAYEWVPEYAWLEPLLPTVLGHEIVGKVLEKRYGIAGPEVGDRVAVRPAITCGICPACVRGNSQRCPRRARIGFERNGGLVPRLGVPAGNLYPIPSHVDEESASLTEPLTVAVRALANAVIRPGAQTAVFGVGAIGLLGAQILKARGAGSVGIVGVETDRVGGGLAVGEAFGATGYVADDPALAELAGKCEVVLVAAGSPFAVQSALTLAAPGSQVIIVGLGIGQLSVNGDSLVRRDIQLRGSFASVASDWLDAIDLLSAGLVIGRGIVSHRYGLADARLGFEALAEHRARKVCIYPGRENV
jgi:threonine dehydrogenase-like Zn-dependent dehydrogenase